MIAPVILAFTLAAPLLAGVENLRSTAEWVDHTDRVIAQATLLEKLIFEAESAFRGFLISRNAEDRTSYTKVLEQLPANTLILRSLISDNPRQQAVWAMTEHAMAEWQQRGSKELAALDAGGAAPPRRLGVLASGISRSCAMPSIGLSSARVRFGRRGPNGRAW